MAHAEALITIERSAKDVYDFLMDGTNNPKWRPSVLDIARVPGSPDGVGAAYKQGLKGPGGRIDGDYTVVECKPDEMIKFQVTAGPARPTGVYILQSSGGSSTKVTFTLDFQPKGLAALMNGMIQKTMQGEVGLLTNLKSVLENQKS
jgi:uncharacterized membrane protein